MAATVRPASTAPTFSDQSHLHIPMQGFPERMGRGGRSRSESRLSLPRSDSVFSLSRMRPPSAASSSCSVASHSRRQVYTVDRDVLLAKAGYRAQETPPPPTPLRLVKKTRRIVGTISVADLLIIAKGVAPIGLQQARSSRAQSVTTQFMANDGSYAREQRYSSLGALQSLGKTPWDLLGLSNEDFRSTKEEKGESFSQFLRQQTAPTGEWARGLKGQATKGRFAAGSHGCLNLTTGPIRGDSKGSSRTRSLDNVHFMEYSPTGKRGESGGATSPLSPPSQRRGMGGQEEEDYVATISPPTSRKGHRDDEYDEDADDEEDWLSLLSPSAAKTLRALDEAERPYASHRRRKSRKHRDQDEEESPASGSPLPSRKYQRTKRPSESSEISAEEDIAEGRSDRFTAPASKSPKSPRRRPFLKLNGNLSSSSIPKTDDKYTSEYGKSNNLPSPSRDYERVGKFLPLAPGSPRLQHKWTTKSNLSPLISPEFGRKLTGGVGLFDKSPSPLSPKLGFHPGLRRGAGTPPSPRTPAKQRRVKLKNVDAKWPAPLSPDALRKQMMETESAETAPIAEEVINPEFETLLNFLIAESAKQAAQLNHDSKVISTSENRKSPTPMIVGNNNDFNSTMQELNSAETIDVTEQTLQDISLKLEKSNQSSIYVAETTGRLSPIPKPGSRSPSPYKAASQSESVLSIPPARPPSPVTMETATLPVVPTYENVPFPSTLINDQEKISETFSANVTNTITNNTDLKDLPEINIEVQVEKRATDSKENKEDWLSLLSPMGARSMRALSEAERPYANLTTGSKEKLNFSLQSELDETSNNQRYSRSPSPYSTGSLKGKRGRPTRPPYPLALQIKGSKSSHLDLMIKENDTGADFAPMKPSRRRSFSQQSNSHSFSQRSVTSETSFESYELNSNKERTSRSPSLCSSLRGKRGRPSRPPLPLVLQSRASVSSNLNLQPMETEGTVSPAQYDLGTPHEEFNSVEIEDIMDQTEPAIIPCNLTQKRTSRTPSPYSNAVEQTRKSPSQLSRELSPFTSKLSKETTNQIRPHSSPLMLFPEQCLSVDTTRKTVSRTSSPNSKAVSRTPSPYNKAIAIEKVTPNHLPQDASLLKSHHEQLFVCDVSQKSGSRSTSPHSQEPAMVMANELPRNTSPFTLPLESSLLTSASQKSVSHSSSPYSRISELRRETANRLPQEASSIKSSLESSLLLDETQKASPHVSSPYSRISELRRGSVNRLQKDVSPPELSFEHTLLDDITQKSEAHSSSPYSRISELRRESKNRLPQEAIQPQKSSPKQSFLSIFSKKSGSRSASPHSAISECGSGTPSSLHQSESTTHNNQITEGSLRISHKRDSNISNLSTRFTEIKPEIKEDGNENNLETVNLDAESPLSNHKIDDTLYTDKLNEVMAHSESTNYINEEPKSTRPPRPSPPPPLTVYRKSPVLLSSILGANAKTVFNGQPQAQNDAQEEEETISHSYRFNDLYANTGPRKGDKVTYTQDDIKAILRGEKPLRPPPPVIQPVQRRSSSESSVGEIGNNKAVSNNQENETEKVESQTEEANKEADNKEDDLIVTGESAVAETKQQQNAESAININSPEEEFENGQTRPLIIQSGKAAQPPPPPPLHVNQRRQSHISPGTDKKDLELPVNPSEESTTSQAQTEPQVEPASAVSLSHSYLYDVYASASARKDRVTYTRDDIKALLSGEKPVRPPRPYLLHRASIASSLETPKNETETNTVKENLEDVATTTEELSQQIVNITENVVTALDTAPEPLPNNEINQTKSVDTVCVTDVAPIKEESIHTETSAPPLPVVDSKAKAAVPKRPIRPPLPQILLSKSASSANLTLPKEKPSLPKSPVKGKKAPDLRPQGSRSPSPMSFKSIRGIGNTRLPMRPPLPVNILVQQWLDKQCKPN